METPLLTPQQEALQAIALFLNEEGFATGWLDIDQDVLVVQSNISFNYGIPATFRVCFVEGSLFVARTILVYDDGNRDTIRDQCIRHWGYFDLSHPRCFDQIIRVLERE